MFPRLLKVVPVAFPERKDDKEAKVFSPPQGNYRHES